MLTIAVSALSQPKAVSKQSQNLQKLFCDFEQKQARNTRYLERQNRFLTYFKAEVAEVEQQTCTKAEQFIQHLFSFLSFKTIKGSQRNTLYRWLREELYELAPNPFQQLDIAGYHQQIDQVWLAELQVKHASPLTKAGLKQVRQQLSDALMHHLELDDAALTELWANEAGVLAFMAEIRLQQLQQIKATLEPAQSSELPACTPYTVAMTELAHFDANDFIHACAQANAAQADIVLSLDKEQRLAFEKALALRIRELNQQYHTMQQATDLASHMWRQFGGGTQAEQQKAVMVYQEELKAAMEGLEEYCQQITTAKDMNQMLSDRAQYYYGDA